MPKISTKISIKAPFSLAALIADRFIDSIEPHSKFLEKLNAVMQRIAEQEGLEVPPITLSHVSRWKYLGLKSEKGRRRKSKIKYEYDPRTNTWRPSAIPPLVWWALPTVLDATYTELLAGSTVFKEDDVA